jgi:predicted nucleic acid-binding protein
VPGIVVADTSPLRYLVLIGHDDVLPRLFGAVSVPTTVADEMRHPRSPDAARTWIATPPPWLAVHPDPAVPAPELQRLDRGERAAIALAHTLGAGLLLIDDRAGVVAACGPGFRVTGTIGVLIGAASQSLLDLVAAFAALCVTNFRHAPGLLDTMLAAGRQERGR